MPTITVEDLMEAVKNYEDPYEGMELLERPDLTDYQREVLEEMAAEEAERVREEEKAHREWEIDRVFSRFLNGNQHKNDILMDKHAYWAKKEADCEMCGLKSVKVPTNYYGKNVDVPSTRVWRINKDQPWTEENTLSLCQGCGTKGRGKNIMAWVLQQLPELQQEHVKELCKKGYAERGKQQALKYYRATRERKEDKGDWFEQV